MADPFAGYEHVWCCDTEYRAPPGERVEPVCLVARDYLDRDAERVEVWFTSEAATPPVDLGSGSLFVAYAASAEFSVFKQLGWPKPSNVLDLLPVMRALTNDGEKRSFNGAWPPSLLSSLKHYGIADVHISEALRRKDAMRSVILDRANYTEAERARILQYCDSDVRALFHLLDLLIAHGHLTDDEPTNRQAVWQEGSTHDDTRVWVPGALPWGDYGWAVAGFEHVGMPVDVPVFNALREHRREIRVRLGEAVESEHGFGVFEAGGFKPRKFAEFLERTGRGASWPKTKTGAFRTDKDILKEMVGVYPDLEDLRRTKKTLTQLNKFAFGVGRDGRHRCPIFPFKTRTGRNAPGRSLLASAGWLRGLVRPEPGRALAYLDWGQQEYGIAAALSEDPELLATYTSGDIYRGMARLAGFDPAVPGVRDIFKVVGLALLYGQTAQSMARALGKSVGEAEQLHLILRQRYSRFFDWQETVVNHGQLAGVIWTKLGWPLLVTENTKERTLLNYMMQGTGADMLRLFCALHHSSRADYDVVAPLHDAVLIEAPQDRLAEAIEHATGLMGRASEILLGGLRLRTDALVIGDQPGQIPRMLEKPKHQEFWNRVMGLLREIDPGLPDWTLNPCHGGT